MYLFMLLKGDNSFEGLSTLVTCVNLNAMSAALMLSKLLSSEEAFPSYVTLMVVIKVLLGRVVGTIIVIHVDEAIGVMVKPTVLDKKARGVERFFTGPALIVVNTFSSRNPAADINQVRVDNSR